MVIIKGKYMMIKKKEEGGREFKEIKSKMGGAAKLGLEGVIIIVMAGDDGRS